MIARAQLQKPEVITKLRAAFGKEIIQDEQINRRVLGKIIFQDEQKRQILNQILHPLIIQEIKHLIKDAKELVFVDVPLLYEAKMEALFDKIIVVWINRDQQLKRLMKRDRISEAYALLKINSQDDLESKKARADFVIDNNGRPTHTQFQVEQILRRLKNEN